MKFTSEDPFNWTKNRGYLIRERRWAHLAVLAYPIYRVHSCWKFECNTCSTRPDVAVGASAWNCVPLQIDIGMQTRSELMVGAANDQDSANRRSAGHNSSIAFQSQMQINNMRQSRTDAFSNNIQTTCRVLASGAAGPRHALCSLGILACCVLESHSRARLAHSIC